MYRNALVGGAGLKRNKVKYTGLATDLVDTDLTSVSSDDDTLASAKAIKTAIDASGATLAAMTDTAITSPTDAALLLYDTGTSTWRDATMSGHGTISDTGALSITDASASVITGQSAETSVAGDDVLILYDTSASALRKMTRANFLSGIAASALNDLSDVTIASNGDAHILIYDNSDSRYENKAISGDVTISNAGVAAIGSGVVVDADVNASAAIAISKTALVAGTGITLSTNTLNIDAAQTQITSVGALDGGTITSGFGTIDTGSSTITTTGLISGGSLDIDNVLINGTTIGHTDDTDLITLADGVVTVAGEISVTTLDIGGTNVTSTAAELNLLDGVSGLAQADFTKLAAIDATAAEINLLDALDRGSILYGNASGATAVLGQGGANTVLTSDGTDISWAAIPDASTITISENNSTDETVYPIFVDGATGSQGLESDTGLTYNPSTGVLTATSFVGAFTGTVTDASHVTITDNESTNENNLIPFVEDAASSTGNHGLEMDGDFHYNPSTGAVTATTFVGNVTGNVTGNASGTAATVTGGTQAAITTLANATTVGALDAGSITSGFGTINTGSSAITTTGLISGGSLDIDDVLINGSTIGHTDDTDLITVADGLVTVAGEISVTTLDIGGTNVTSTAAELNIMDGGTSASSTTLADADRVVVNDNGAMKQVALTDFETYMETSLDTLSNVTTVGALNAGSITSGFGSIDTGSSNITTTGTVSAGNLTVTGTTTTVNSTTMTVVDPLIHLQTASGGGNLASDTNKDVGLVMEYHNGSAAKEAFLGWDDSAGKLTFVPDASISSEVVSGSVGTIVANLEGNVTGNVTGNTSGTAATVTGAAQSAITSLGTLTTLTVDNVIINGTTIGHTDDTDLITLADGVATVAGELDATSLDISGDADIDGTLEADAITVDGTALNEYIADTVGAMVTSNTESGITVAYQDGDNTLDFTVGTLNQDTTGNSATATALETARTIGGTSFNGSADIVPATITVADTTDTSSYVALFESATGDLAPKTDAGITYNAGTGMLTATGFTGPVTGNASTATALASGRTIGMTGDVVWTSASFDGSGNVTGSAVIQATSVENSMLAGSIADSKLNTISTAGKVDLAALEIDGGTDIGEALVDADLFIVDNGAGGTNRKMAASRIKTYIGAADEGFAIAMSIAL